MLGSMYSAVSGLSAHQTKMDVIGNNIANVNTYGFKASRVTFSDVFYQTLRGASAPTSSSGGINPTQLGYGARVNSIDVIHTRAGSASTNRPMDVYINGDGYIPVKDANGTVKYTRVGILGFDVSGNLVDNNGNLVLGLPLNSSTNMPRLGSDGTVSIRDLVPIKVDPAELEKFTGISIGSNGEITAIREGDPIIVPEAGMGWLQNASISASSSYKGNIFMSATRSDDVAFLPGTNPDGTTIGSGSVSVDPTANINGPVRVSFDGTNYTLTYTKKGESTPQTVTVAGPAAGDVTFEVEDMDGNPVDLTITVGPDLIVPDDETVVTIGNVVAESMSITVRTYDASGDEVNLTTTWNAGDTELRLGDMTLTIDPARFGTLSEDALDDTRIGSMDVGAGRPMKFANLAAVKFANVDALSQDGEGYYVETTNSGQPVGTIPGTGGTGDFRANSLEMSNVDLAREFTEMIIAQRGFQANTRMISVSDEMLAELVNMKR